MSDNIEAPASPASATAGEAAPASLPSPGDTQAGIALPAWAPEVTTDAPDRWTAPPEGFDVYTSPALTPSAYDLPPLYSDGEVSDDVVSEALGIRNTLWEAGFPKFEGEAVMQAAVEAAKAIDMDMDDGALQLRARETETQLRSMLGDQEYESRRGALNKLIAAMDKKSNGAFGAYLDDVAPVLSDVNVQFRLLAHASQLESRRRR